MVHAERSLNPSNYVAVYAGIERRSNDLLHQIQHKKLRFVLFHILESENILI